MTKLHTKLCQGVLGVDDQGDVRGMGVSAGGGIKVLTISANFGFQ